MSRTTDILKAATNHAHRLGVFESVTGHEPRSAPGRGLRYAMWVQSLSPAPRASGLGATSGLLVLNGRIYCSFVTGNPDEIDPAVTDALDLLMDAYSADFTLGGAVRDVDLLGEHGPSLSAIAGYLEQDNKLFRIMTLTIPLIINDLWNQEA